MSLRKKEIAYSIITVLLVLTVVELSLRTAGFIAHFPQSQWNHRSLFGRDPIRILCIGESTTADNGTRSWPRFLQQLLDERLGKGAAEVFNVGIVGATTNLLLSRLDRQLEEYRPHLVITMLGINDGNHRYRFDGSFRSSFWLGMERMRLWRLAIWTWEAARAVLTGASHRGEKSLGEPLPSEKIFLSELNGLVQKYAHPQAVTKALSGYRNGDITTAAALVEAGKLLYLNYDEDNPGEREAKIAPAMELLGLAAVKLAPDSFEALSLLGQSHYNQRMKPGYREKCISTNSQILKINHVPHKALRFPLANLAGCIPEFEQLEGIWKEADNTVPFRYSEKSGIQITRQNYQDFHRAFRADNIIWLAMQYPLSDVGTLRYLISDQPLPDQGPETFSEAILQNWQAGFEQDAGEIYFLENKNNFLTALKNGETYGDLFTDRFARKFGHTTPEGDWMIARNVGQKLFDMPPFLQLMKERGISPNAMAVSR